MGTRTKNACRVQAFFKLRLFFKLSFLRGTDQKGAFFILKNQLVENSSKQGFPISFVFTGFIFLIK